MLLGAGESRSVCDNLCDHKPKVLQIREDGFVRVPGDGFLEGTTFGKSRKRTASGEELVLSLTLGE